MKQVMQYIKTLLFGIRAQGEQLPEPTLPPERPLDENYVEWCKEFKLGMLYDRKTVHL
jgi:hypothetical protein